MPNNRAPPHSTLPTILPIERLVRQHVGRPFSPIAGDPNMGKGNHSQKNDKKNKKPKQDKTKPAAKK